MGIANGLIYLIRLKEILKSVNNPQRHPHPHSSVLDAHNFHGGYWRYQAKVMRTSSKVEILPFEEEIFQHVFCKNSLQNLQNSQIVYGINDLRYL
jgi:hypothetical protein